MPLSVPHTVAEFRDLTFNNTVNLHNLIKDTKTDTVAQNTMTFRDFYEQSKCPNAFWAHFYV